MRLIKTPADVKVKVNEETSDLFTFKKVLIDQIDNYGETKTVSQLRQAAKIIDKIEAGNGTISLEDAEYEIVKAACSKIVYKPVLARQLLSYFDSVEAAEEVGK